MLREELYILANCCLSPIRRNSLLEKLTKRLAVIQEDISVVQRFVSCMSLVIIIIIIINNKNKRKAT